MTHVCHGMSDGLMTDVCGAPPRFIVSLVLLNLLIALMGSSYESAQEQAVSGALFEQATIVLEVEALMTREERQREDWFPLWVHVLRLHQKELLSDEEKLLHGVRTRMDDIHVASEFNSEKLDKVQSKLESVVGTQVEASQRKMVGLANTHEAKRWAHNG